MAIDGYGKRAADRWSKRVDIRNSRTLIGGMTSKSMCSQATAAPDGERGELASSRLSVTLVPLRGVRRWLSFLIRAILFIGILGDSIDDWPPLRVEIVDVRTGKCVYREKGLMGSGDAAGIKEGIERDLHSLTLKDFCARYEVTLDPT